MNALNLSPAALELSRALIQDLELNPPEITVTKSNRIGFRAGLSASVLALKEKLQKLEGTANKELAAV